jgi:hypothetical protein
MKISMLLLAAAAAGLPGCLTSGCGDVGAVQGLDVQFTVVNGPLQPGAYTIVVDADGLDVTLDTIVEADGSSRGDTVELADGAVHLDVTGALFATLGDVRIGYREGGGPASITVTVKQGATVLGTQSYTPSYYKTYPDGQCGPVGIDADGTLTVTAP